LRRGAGERILTQIDQALLEMRANAAAAQPLLLR
jgi:hypothetical protein